MTEIETIIAEQQAGHENEPLFMVGEQLKEIAAREPRSAELLKQDLAVKEMSLGAAAKKLQEYADKNHGKARSFCVTPFVAEGILRKFYGLPERGEAPAEEAPAESAASGDGYIDLSSFL